MLWKTNFIEISSLSSHLAMLLDRVRVETFNIAIKELVSPETIAMDIGCGTGLLTCLLCHYGAKKVYAVETSSKMINIAKSTIRDNGYEDRVIFVESSSFNLKLEEKVGLVVSETLGVMGVDEGICDILSHARSELLENHGMLIPESIKIYAGLVCLRDQHLSKEQLVNDIHFDLSSFLSAYVTMPSKVSINSSHIRSNVVEVKEVQLGYDRCEEIKFTQRFHCARGLVTGLALWFDAHLTNSCVLSTSPFSLPTSWGQTYFPFSEEIYCDADNRCTVLDVHIIPHCDGVFGHIIANF